MNLAMYYRLAKPGMVYGNAIPFIGGFVMATGADVKLWRLIPALIGISLVIASACVYNNCIDRDHDAHMERTKNRALVTGTVSLNAALIYASILGMLGFFTLALRTNLLAAFWAAIGFLFYVVVYSMWVKKRSSWAVAVGAVAGAVPPVAGYCAASGRFDIAAILLFAIMFFWQMPHFFSISMYRLNDYRAAGFPVAPHVNGLTATKWQMSGYSIAFTGAAALLPMFSRLGLAYSAVALALGAIWIIFGLKGFAIPETQEHFARNAAWARTMFFLSLAVLIALFLTIIISSLL